MIRVALPPAPAGGRRYGHWMDQALAGESLRVDRLEGQRSADLAIVGGGYVGLWTAIRIAEEAPDLSVAVLEADLCGSGASGRNGGFAFGWWPKIETLVERVGAEEAVQLAVAAEAAVGELDEFCAAEGIDAEMRRGGWLWTATSDAQEGAWRGAMAACERLGARPFRELDAAEVRRRAGSPIHRGGTFEAVAATVHPAKLARGLADAARRRGVLVYERSPVRRLDRRHGELTTARGTLRAGAVVLAANAWMASIRELRRAVIPLSSDVVATEPMQPALSESGWTGGEAISDSRLMVHYYRTTADGRVVLGKGGGGLGAFGRFPGGFDHHGKRARLITEELHRLVPATVGVPIASTWGGAVDRSTDGLPFFGSLEGGVAIHYGAGFSGNGVVPSLLAGRILAGLVLERQDRWARCGLARGVPGRFPFEPVRSVGGVVVRAAVRRKELREDRGQRPGRLTSRVAALAPSGFFKVGDEEAH